MKLDELLVRIHSTSTIDHDETRRLSEDEWLFSAEEGRLQAEDEEQHFTHHLLKEVS
jgi:hypothetical protein